MTLSDMVRKREELDALAKVDKKKSDKEELANNIASKIRTAFIGAIAAFEQEFGYIWGHGALRPTANQLQLKEVWTKVRKMILDKGNDQIKFARNEIDKYEMEKVGVRTEVDLDSCLSTWVIDLNKLKNGNGGNNG